MLNKREAERGAGCVRYAIEWGRIKNDNPSVSYADTSLYTREAKLGESAYVPHRLE